MKSLLGKLGVILIGLASFSYVEVWGAEWKFYTESENEKFFCDVESITKPSKNIVKVWVKMEYTDRGVNEMVKELGKKYENISYTKSLEEINCSDNKSRTLSLNDYSKEGKIIFGSNRENEWEYIVPESVTDTLRKAVCK